MGKLGKGSFGQVVEAWDAHKREYVAIKIIKNKSAFTKQALVEERILNVLAKRQREMTPSTSGKHIGTNRICFQNSVSLSLSLNLHF